jgi:hypothetical protein
MATGTSRRGGVATDPPVVFDPSNLRVVEPERELSRRAAPTSEYRPLVEYALASINRKIENTKVVMEASEDGGEPTPKLDERGEPMRESVTYSKDDAVKLHDGLRAAADGMKLPTSRKQSLRIIVEPKLKDGPADARYSVQWYVINLGKSTEGASA